MALYFIQLVQWARKWKTQIMLAAVNCDMFFPITASKMLGESVKRIKEDRGEQL